MKKNATIESIMTKDLTTLAEGATLTDAAKAMRDADVGGVVVTNGAGKLTGFLTDRDIVVRALADRRDPSTTKLSDVCSRDIVHLGPEQTIADAIELMSKASVRRMPVVKNGQAVGVVSLGDLAVSRDPESLLGQISAAPATR